MSATQTHLPGTATELTSATSGASWSHPLDPLTPDEITAVALTVRNHIVQEQLAKAIKFITCYLIPPPKKDVLRFLGIPLTPDGTAESKDGLVIVRKAEVDFLDVVSGASYNATVTFESDAWKVKNVKKLPEGVQPQISVEELIAAEGIVRADKRVQEYAKAVGIEPEQIHCDGWSIGWDERFPQSRRVQQALVFARFSQHENLYAHPMDFIPVIDANSGEVLAIDFPAHYTQTPIGPSLSSKSASALSGQSLEESGRERIPPPLAKYDFLPDLLPAGSDPYTSPSQSTARSPPKPLHITQPEGVSFSMNGNTLTWQNWSMHIAFHHREGIALSTVTYNNRPIVYRLSCAEMVVPYAAPEFPHPRKFAFDSGEYGMGTMANELSLGCDCVGTIHYLPGAYVGNDGKAVVIKNVICIHEEDSGVLWKHTDYRVGGRSQTVRRRRLVVSMVCTLANYEYIWNYHFYQDGTIELEIRLTGILQVYVSKDGEPTPYGTQVAPRVNAHYHQHLFSLRLDPMIDGLYNSVVESDVFPLPLDESNPAGNGFRVQERTIAEEGGLDWDYAKERRWKIVNPSKTHYSSGKPVGFTLGVKGALAPVFAHPDEKSWVTTRAGFTKHPIWVVRDEETEEGESRMWPAGKYVPQTRSTPKDSVGEWVKGKKKVENEDLVVFLTVGTTHVPRPEDWPVMPAETLHVTLKPNSFFDANPSMDVPGMRDANDKLSKPAFDSSDDSCGCHDKDEGKAKEGKTCSTQ